MTVQPFDHFTISLITPHEPHFVVGRLGTKACTFVPETYLGIRTAFFTTHTGTYLLSITPWHVKHSGERRKTVPQTSASRKSE